MELLTKTWKTIDGQEIKNLPELLAGFVKDNLEIHVGTDSQQNGLKTEYATVIAIVTPGKGGRAFYMTEKVTKIRNLRERLLKEVWMSVSVAMEINEILPNAEKMHVHVDANPNLSFKSSAYIKELTALVVSQGFDCLLKPDSWCASHAADHVVKHKVIGRQ